MYTELYPNIVSPHTMALLANDAGSHNDYLRSIRHFPLIQTTKEAWDADLAAFMADPLSDIDYNDPFFNYVAVPMYWSWHQRKCKTGDGREYAKAIRAEDWKQVCVAWIERRAK